MQQADVMSDEAEVASRRIGKDESEGIGMDLQSRDQGDC